MTTEEIYEKLNMVFRDVFDDDDIIVTENTTSDDIEDWESFTHISLVIAVEEEFGISFSVGETNVLKNVGEMVDLIKKKMGNG